MIVINYRRADAGGYALHIHSQLSQALGKDRVFLDVGGELSGNGDYEQYIFNKIRQSRLVVCLIGPSWLTAASSGFLRLHEPDDLVRREIDCALQHNKRLLPVLLNGALMPDRLSLPSCVSDITRFNAERFRHECAEGDMRALLLAVRRSLGRSAAQNRSVQPPTLYSNEAIAGLERLVQSTAANALMDPSAGWLKPRNALNALSSISPSEQRPFVPLEELLRKKK